MAHQHRVKAIKSYYKNRCIPEDIGPSRRSLILFAENGLGRELWKIT